MADKVVTATLKTLMPPLLRRPAYSVLKAYRFLRNDKGLWKTRHRLAPWLPLPRRLPEGYWMWCYPDVMGRNIFEGRPFEANERAFVAKFLRPGMTFFDIGAHHGLYSWLASKRVGAQGRVYAFEPVPREFGRLCANLRLNRFPNVLLQQMAIGNCEAALDMYVVEGRESGCNSLRQPSYDVGSKTSLVKVPVMPLDKYVEGVGISKIDLIKIDTEGGELDVLRGAERLLAGAHKPTVMCEMEDRRTGPWGYRAKETVDWLAQRGYVWFEPTQDGLVPHQGREYYAFDGLVAVPAEEVSQLGRLLADVSYLRKCTADVDHPLLDS